MLHRIAMSQTAAGDLNLIFLGPDGQQLLAYNQTADGVWHPTKQEAPGPVAIPNPQNLTFQAILGLNGGNGLLALDLAGKLWFTTQQGNNWNADGFTRVPNQNDLSFTDFGACETSGTTILIASLASASENDNNAFTQFGPPGSLSRPGAVGGIIAPGPPVSLGSIVNWSSIAVADTPAVLFAIVGGGSGGAAQFAWGGGGGYSWELGTTSPVNTNLLKVAALAASGGTLQAIVLDQNGFPYLFWDASGRGSDFVPYENGGQLPNPDGLQFSEMAGCVGADGNFQLVGISGGLPYLIWQDAANGGWGVYMNPNGQGMQLPMNSPSAVPLQDLVMGFGNQGFLQVGYIGNDGNVYVNWQDKNGNWGWYGPLP